ncbi:zinc finger and BTB domain-containing protein 17-like isoform X5 [Mya arenaria]|uniref:zinc finger and BTB domain-containing protein 17-like isoform X5 n=1 Tax=Mya arenaria TaxID=6604 RepID=UPI0022E39FA5|nr:zinc finger and BTB domain-containing protein 17-like isoform X5 [Mya arenaria]
MGTELENLKEVPGFKAVLRAVIKAQIQLLLQQLSDHADDESLVLTAGVNDGTISQLGSGTGKGFLEGHEEIKSQFLGHCLKTHHSKAPTETRGSPYQRPLDPFSKKNVPKSSKTLAQPPALKNFGEGYNKHTGDKTIAQMLADKTGSASQSNVNMDKGENMVNFDATKVTFDAGLDLNHTQTSCANESEQSDNELKKMDKLGHKLAPDSTLESENLSNPTSIKIEPITENEMELEITGVEPGQPKAPPTQTWPQGPAFTVTTSGGEVDQGEETTDDGSEAYKRWPSYVKPKVASKHSNSISMETSFELPAYLESSQLNSQWQPDMDSFTQANMDSFIQPNISVKYEANFEQFCRRGRRSSGHPRLLNLYKYACTYCGRLFQSNRNRLRHELIHTNEKPFECSVCGMRFNQKHSMKNHEKRHLAKNCVKMK